MNETGGQGREGQGELFSVGETPEQRARRMADEAAETLRVIAEQTAAGNAQLSSDHAAAIAEREAGLTPAESALDRLQRRVEGMNARAADAETTSTARQEETSPVLYAPQTNDDIAAARERAKEAQLAIEAAAKAEERRLEGIARSEAAELAKKQGYAAAGMEVPPKLRHTREVEADLAERRARQETAQTAAAETGAVSVDQPGWKVIQTPEDVAPALEQAIIDKDITPKPYPKKPN